MMRYVLLFLALATSALAQTPMTGTEFDTYTRGKTLTYLEDGQAYGIEEYLPGRIVKWAFDGSECQDGRWWEAEPGLICFVYKNATGTPQCWQFFQTDSGLRALFKGDEPGPEIYATRISRNPLLCLGPEVGV